MSGSVVSVFDRAIHRFPWHPYIVCPAILVLCAATFLPQQCIWVDETTQLSGLTLGPLEVARWLMGKDGDRFGVPPDRMPPLSYWAGQLWGLFFGLDETSLRWFGVACVALATAVVTYAGSRLGETAGAWAAGLLFALSPNIISTAVDIRPYPLFVLESAIAFAILLDIAKKSGGERSGAVPIGKLCGLSAVCVAAIYTHFYGVVLSAAVWGGLVMMLFLNGRPMRTVWIWLSGVLLLSLGLIPFVKQSASISAFEVGKTATFRELARLGFRLYGHPAVSINTWAVVLATLGVIAAMCAIGYALRRGSMEMWVVCAPIALGLAATVFASGFVRTFKVLSPNYSAWMWPAVSLALAAPWLACQPPRLRRVLSLAVVAIGIAQCSAAAELLFHGTYLSHGPHHEVVKLIEARDASKVVVVHEGPEYAFAYFPLHFRYGAHLKQYLATSGTVPRLKPLGGSGADTASLDDRASGRVVVVVNARNCATDEIRHALHGVPIDHADGPFAQLLKREPGWKCVEEKQTTAFVGASISVFRRTSADWPSVSSTSPPVFAK